jgi:SP family sugar:H+ symporter-like MFS transporter
MFMCFMVFASVGKFGAHDASGNPAQTEGYVLIIFSCLFIAAFASTWGELPQTAVVRVNISDHPRWAWLRTSLSQGPD